MGLRTQFDAGIFCWIDLMAHEIEGAKRFYSEVFGWSAEDQDTQGGPPYVMFRHGEHSVAGLGEMPEEMKSGGMPPVWNSYISVGDAEAVAAKATELGGTVTMPLMQVMTAGRMAGIQDPTGAYFFIWEPQEHFGAELVNQTGAWGWNELATRDIETALKFYGELFGWTYESSSGAMSRYEIIHHAGRMNGGIMAMTEAWGDAPPNWSVYVTVDDVPSVVAKVREAGGGVIAEPFDMDVGTIAVVTDPQGAAFNVIRTNEEPDE
ncbi:VOC family protein [Stratiformator vulcanicus]|uniref:27 kDa antigen Cfp30B n=1 Tax=Stratiformator vulcanicus TaxID=2527980 RepID=A0A517QXX3_9PLAN|nr:VOC family protein [Stratiformator vulcanicus]QDT36457.1 27 kDa antigen Cfp30B [Stratiformator vulcanicus]